MGQAYNKTITASGGTGPYIFTVIDGSLPTGLTLATNGVLSGTLTGEGTFIFTVLATDQNGCTGKRQHLINVYCPSITVKPSTLSGGTVGRAYEKVLVASGGSAPYVFKVTDGSIPTGLTLTPAGVLSGTPTAEGFFNFTILATDRYGCIGKRDYLIVVKCSTITVSPLTLSNGMVNHPYNTTITATGGITPYVFSIEDGQLPTGLTLSPDGVLSGTPIEPGYFLFTILATDSFGCSGKRQYLVHIDDCPSITVKPLTLSNGTAGQSYSKTITATGGAAPYVFTIETGSLPNGLTLSTGGLLSGTPTATGDFTFVILATDAFGCTGKRQYTITINCPGITLTPSSLPSGAINQPYNRTITATGGLSPYNFVVFSGNLPPGLTLAPNGVLSGTPTANGTFNFTVLAKDNNGCSGKRYYTLSISGPR